MSAISEQTVVSKHLELVEREIEGELLVIPIMAGVGDADANLYSFNEQGAAIWKLMDGTRSVGEIADAICAEYEVAREQVIREIITFCEDMLSRNLIQL